MTLTREAILAAEDRPAQKVDVPEWGGSVFVRALSLKQQAAHEEKARGQTPERVAVLLAITSTVDENSVPIFKDEDAPALEEKSSGAVQRIVKAAIALNAMSEAEIEGLRKNS
jgi:hypothetical protein